MNGKYIIGEKDMKIKLQITLDELEILVDSLDSELHMQESFIGDKEEDEYDRKLYEETKALINKLDKRLLKEKEKKNDN
mgnify:FL=1|tara:strand:- start:150 stop:386 length:237 start_codon:yes stop_codon:yes gene_type:complete